MEWKMKKSVIGYVVDAVGFCAVLFLVGAWGDFWANPIWTILTIGFYVKNALAFVGWEPVGWIVCIVIEAYIVVKLIDLFFWVRSVIVKRKRDFGKGWK